MRRYGVHCSIRGGLTNALEETKRLGANTVQIFTRSPRMWSKGRLPNLDAAPFQALRKKYDIDPLVVHTPYLPNLCTSNPELYEKSYQAFIDDLDDTGKLGGAYLVIHPGAYSEGQTPQVGIEQLIKAMNRALAEIPNQVMVLIENMAGGGRRMGAPFEEIRAMMAGIHDQKRIGMCLDTAHTIAAGFPIDEPAGIDQTLKELHEHVGLDRVKVIHVNDSKAARGAHRDLHQHLGKGFIGEKAFAYFFKQSGLDHATLILETPKDTPESDPTNLNALRQWI